MPDKKLTDNEIIKALECCKERVQYEGNENTCCSCSLITDDGCTCTLAKHSLDLINRQKEEIERLTSGKCVYLSDDETTEYCVEGPCPNYKTEAQIKAEAYKEFAERLKKFIKANTVQTVFFGGCCLINEKNVDEILKEMRGG